MAALEKSGHMYSLEDVKVNEACEIRRKLLVMPKDEEREKIVERVLGAAGKGKCKMRFG